MRYTEEKDTKNIFRSQAVTASNRWDKSACSSFLAICKTASVSSGKSLWTGCLGPGLKFWRLWPLSLLVRHLTTRRRLILQKTQLRVTVRPFSLARSTITRISIFRSSLSHWPSICPTNPHSFFFATPPVLRPALQEPVLSLPIPFLWHHSFLFLPEDISLFESLMVCSFQLCRGWGSSGRPTG